MSMAACANESGRVQGYVDFHFVPAGQEDIHERLQSWGRWCHSTERRTQSPMFANYRASEVWGSQEATIPINSLDALQTEKCVRALCELQAWALRWYYVNTRFHNPRRAARMMGLSLSALAAAVIDGRDALKGRL